MLTSITGIAELMQGIKSREGDGIIVVHSSISDRTTGTEMVVSPPSGKTIMSASYKKN